MSIEFSFYCLYIANSLEHFLFPFSYIIIRTWCKSNGKALSIFFHIGAIRFVRMFSIWRFCSVHVVPPLWPSSFSELAIIGLVHLATHLWLWVTTQRKLGICNRSILGSHSHIRKSWNILLRTYVILRFFCESLVHCRSVAQSCPSLCNPLDCSTPDFPVFHHLPEFAQTHVNWVCDAIQPSHLLLSPSLPAFNLFPASGSFLMSRLWLIVAST